MKICPHCQTTYTDDSLQFCLQDGSPLVAQPVSQNWSESETLVSPKFTTRKTDVGWQESAADFGKSRQAQTSDAPKKSNTGLIIALTALVTLLVIGAAAAGILIYQRNKKIETAQNTNANAKPVNVNFPSVVNMNRKTANANVNADVSPSPLVAPLARPTLNPKETEAVKSDVKNVIGNWQDATESRDINAHLDNYAATVDYYRAGKVNLARVRVDKEQAYSMYDSIEINIGNLKITPDETGEKAVATFDKEWNFQGDAKSSSGKVEQQLTFAKIGGRWLITGERDLKVYYVDK